jgi:sugar phosphate isomerase/epimerase
MLQVDLLHHSILGRRARVQSDDHHVQANLPAAKTTIHTMRNRNIETAKLACFLNSLRPSLIRVVRRKNIERTKRKIGIAAAMKAMILKIIVHSQCRVTRSFDHLVGAGEQRRWDFDAERIRGFEIDH